MLIIGLPTAFWMLMLELLAPLVGFDFGIAGRICAAIGLVAALGGVWSLLCVSSETAVQRLPETGSDEVALAAGVKVTAS